jgi:hypothetical protein
MGEMVIKYDTLSLSQQVIERQEGHAHRLASHHNPLGEAMTTGPSDDELLPGEHPPFDEADEADVLEQELEVPDDDEDYERG